MATKTISIELDVYERLRGLKKSPSESFSQVLRRELPAVHGLLASELLRRSKVEGGLLQMSEDELRMIEEIKDDLHDWNNPWTR